MMTGSSVQASVESGLVPATLWWRNRITTEPASLVFIGASEEAWSAISAAVLEAAGIGSDNQAEVRSTWIELIEQAASGLAGVATAESGKAVESQSGSEVPEPSGPRQKVVIQVGDLKVEIALVTEAEQAAVAIAAPVRELDAPKPVTSRTMDALLDVQLPVSISFGHARMPLKDVLKLTSGTVVELNRHPEDPVEIIVNDCVIARGEVVVMDGNYAVRIQSIIGRQDRLSLRPGRSANGRQVK